MAGLGMSIHLVGGARRPGRWLEGDGIKEACWIWVWI
jgi:hypothetical protein